MTFLSSLQYLLLLLLFGAPFSSSSTAAKTRRRRQARIPKACEPPHDQYPFCQPSLPLDQRLDDLISRLTLEEKPFLLTARESPKGNISRLGIPEYDWGGNCMHGVQSRCAPNGRCPTSFPNPNLLGPTFNKTLWKSIGSVIGLELRALWLQNVRENHHDNLPHIGLDCWSPNLNIVRDPRWGRNVESPSEDPFVVGVYGTMHTLGLQNNSQLDQRFLQAVATLKHFDANSLEGPHWTLDGKWDAKNGNISRHSVNAKISLHDLAMSYWPAFRQAVVQSGAAGIMCSYNSINGVPSCANEWLLQRVLRRDWKFRGYVTSDSGALTDIVKYHKYAKDMVEMITLSLQAGCDVESAEWPPGQIHSTGGFYIDHVAEAVQQHLLDESLVDRAVRNTLAIRFRLGLFDPIEDQPFWNVDPAVVQANEHVQMAKEATAQGFVLLKNEGNNLLPLRLHKTTKIALIGPHINDRRQMAGNYLGELCPGGSYDCITSFAEGFSNATAKYGGTLWTTQGCDVAGTDTNGFQEAKDLASNADMVIVLGGLDHSLEAESKDRPDIRLPSIQSQLIQELAPLCSNFVLVLMHGGMVGLDAVIDLVPVVVSMGYPGIYAGELLPDVLMGNIDNAWGKLAITWYHDNIQEQLNMMDFSMSRPPGRTHRYYTGTPQFAFGHGLNPLTTFAMSKLRVSHSLETEDGMRLSTNITNTGSRAGSEVVLAFFEPPPTIPPSEPVSKLKQQLFGFERAFLQPKGKKEVFIEFSPSTLQLYDADGLPATFPGTYYIKITNGFNFETIAISLDEALKMKCFEEEPIMSDE